MVLQKDPQQEGLLVLCDQGQAGATGWLLLPGASCREAPDVVWLHRW